MFAKGGGLLLDVPHVAPLSLHHGVSPHPHILHQATAACDEVHTIGKLTSEMVSHLLGSASKCASEGFTFLT